MTSSFPLQLLDGIQRVELEHGWELLVDPTARLSREDAEKASGWREARVGLSWNVQFEDLRNYMGAAWYRTSFEVPSFRDTRHVLLKFGAVDYFCEVFLNGFLVGTHEGGYTPFSFEVTNAIRPGVNKLVIKVVDPPMNEAQNRALFPEMMYNEIPHGKQNWYVQISGIWQGVRIECCPSIYIERLDVISKVSGEFELLARLAGIGITAEDGSLASKVRIRAQISDANGKVVFDSSQPLNPSFHYISITGTIRNPRLWEPGNPALYFVEVALSGAIEYRRKTRFGFRSFEAKDGGLFLNGKSFFMIGALDQDFYPETVHTPGSEQSVRDMMTKAKSLGINVLRCHLKVAHPVYLDVADEIGMLVWTELPSWSDCWFPSNHFSTMAAVRAEQMFWEILIRDWNHPCIVLQTIMNESWGIDLKDASQRQWLLATYNRIKGLLEPLGRLVVDNSPCEGNFHIKTDIEDFHQYYSMPDQVQKWDAWLGELAVRPEWTFSPYGDADRTGSEPLLVSEFGNWGLPKLPEELPWWFDVAFGDREVTRPSGVLERFQAYGYNKLFNNFNDLAEETQWHQYISLKHEIESIRSYSSLHGYVITGITDVHWEANGLLDMWRNEKVYSAALRALQQPDLIMCKLPRYCYRAGERVRLETLISHYSGAALDGARVRWSTGSQAGHFAISANVPNGCATKLEPIEFRLPEINEPYCERLEIEIRLKNGERVAENSYDLFVLPPAGSGITEPTPAIAGHGIPEEMISRLKEAGHEISAQPHGDLVVLANRYDATVAAHLADGGTAVIVADSESALPPSSPLTIKFRAGTELDGRWFSNFNWIRPSVEPFSRLAFTSILGFESASVAPEYVIDGIVPEHFDDVLSGITLGWLNHNCALAAQMRVGRGKLIVTTFRFGQYGTEPYATDLLEHLIRYVSSPACRPRFEVAVAVPEVIAP